MKSGIELIAEERARQVEAEGYTAEHDDRHSGGQLADMAACYAIAPVVPYVKSEYVGRVQFDDLFPFSARFDGRERHDRKKRLIIAGALIAAEIDRLNRLR